MVEIDAVAMKNEYGSFSKILKIVLPSDPATAFEYVSERNENTQLKYLHPVFIAALFSMARHRRT